MAQEPSKKRLIIYIMIFVAIAFFIVYFTQKKETHPLYKSDFTDETSYENEKFEPVSFATPEITNNIDTTQPSITVKNSETGIATTTTKEDAEIANVDKKVIKTGEIDMRVNSIEKAINDIKSIAISHGGDEVASDFAKNSSKKSGFIVIKIPVNQYNETFDAIKQIAPLVTHESSRAQDVTAQFIDLESRIKNKKDHEERLRTFFDKAEDVDELIQVERELARVRTEVEQMESQLKYLKDQTQYSTIHVTLLEDENIVISEDWRPLQVMKDSFNTLIKKSTNLFNSVIRFTITSLPFIVLIGAAVWFLYFTAKHIFGKSDENNQDKAAKK